ncbi:MAG TPA: hypothetical protein VHS03_00955 [Gaiellaceae bacterium]|nr:hypothetical protein [Gaiellaceae bacterium]
MTNRGRTLRLGAACAVVAGGTAVAIVLAVGSPAEAAPTKAEYLAKVAAICRVYGPRLDRVPPPGDIAIPGEIVTSVEKALPILVAESRAVHGLRSPAELKAKLERWHELNDSALDELKRALRLAREPDLGGMGVAYVRYVLTGAKAEKVGKAIGFPRPPC